MNKFQATVLAGGTGWLVGGLVNHMLIEKFVTENPFFELEFDKETKEEIKLSAKETYKKKAQKLGIGLGIIFIGSLVTISVSEHLETRWTTAEVVELSPEVA